MKPAACGLALTLLSANDVCPACGWPASDHPTWPHSRAREPDKPVHMIANPPAPGSVFADALAPHPDGFDAVPVGWDRPPSEWHTLVAAHRERDENHPPSSEVAPPPSPALEPAPFVVDEPRGLEGLSGARTSKLARALRIAGRAALALADVLDE